jgi:dipicolinate synthase subunit B
METESAKPDRIRVGFAVTGSFCTFSKVIPQIDALNKAGYEVVPIMSETAYSSDTRFGTAADFRERISSAAGNKKIIHSIQEAEPIGPKKLLDILVLAPCTGNTLGKLAYGINDTCVTMAAKAHLRNGRPLLIAVSTNDALSASARSIGTLLNTRNVYFVPMRQDDIVKKPASLVADYASIIPAAEAALSGRQIEPLFI